MKAGNPLVNCIPELFVRSNHWQTGAGGLSQQCSLQRGNCGAEQHLFTALNNQSLGWQFAGIPGISCWLKPHPGHGWCLQRPSDNSINWCPFTEGKKPRRIRSGNFSLYPRKKWVSWVKIMQHSQGWAVGSTGSHAGLISKEEQVGTKPGRSSYQTPWKP